PTQVSREEFDEMVRDIQHETQAERDARQSRSATAERPKPKAKPTPTPAPVEEPTAEEPAEPEIAPEPSSGADLTPDEVVMPKQKPAQRPRGGNRRRGGRPR